MSIFINFLTVSRILLGLIIFLSLTDNNGYLLALILFMIAGISDYFDGYLARKFNATSQIGEILDPIADKILIAFVLFALSINLSSYLIGFAGSIIISRELWVSALRDFNARNNNENATKVITMAKYKTTMQLFSVFIYLFGLAFNFMLLVVIGDILLIIALLITTYTGYIYSLNSFSAKK
jgi:CDP-diacylglycerol--glycerol-3-phosphate 3-phosphatidyltransferase